MRLRRKVNSKKPIVIKIGGSTFGSGNSAVEDVVALQKRGISIIVVHGGGNRVTQWLGRADIPTSFVDGNRVTDAQTLEFVIAVLCGLVNKELVAAINSIGGKAIGLSGIDGGLIQGTPQNPAMGYMAGVIRVNIEPVRAILDAGYIPVIAPGGLRLPEDEDEIRLVNINGDDIAGEVAAALKVERLILLTDVSGICDGSGKLLPQLTTAEVKALISSGVISGGMLPKAKACLKALEGGCRAQIIDGRPSHSLLSAVEGKTSGTEII
jgi:acetylglutamate kinase